MLTYVFNEVGVPLYEQVYKSIKNDIIKGILKPGEKLPSKRTFANNNGISTITIQNAYDQLISEGYIYTDIVEMTGASTATISRVNRCLNYGKGGYRTALERVKEE